MKPRMISSISLRFHWIAAGRWLVEQQHRWLAGERARDFQTLEIAVGQAARRPFAHVFEADADERFGGRFARASVLPSDRRQMQEIGDNSGRLVAMSADHYVRDRRQVREDLRILERA